MRTPYNDTEIRCLKKGPKVLYCRQKTTERLIFEKWKSAVCISQGSKYAHGN